jgi:hypothetical protein
MHISQAGICVHENKPLLKKKKKRRRMKWWTWWEKNRDRVKYR